MPLVTEVLKTEIENGFKEIFKAQSAKATQDGAEQEDPNEVINNMCDKMAKVVANAVEKYVKSGDIYIKAENVTVTSPHGPCVVAPATPAKIV